jgi:hypothetical protein
MIRNYLSWKNLPIAKKMIVFILRNKLKLELAFPLTVLIKILMGIDRRHFEENMNLVKIVKNNYFFVSIFF